jgi:hypothetical protein
MAGALDHSFHLGCRVEGQAVLGKTGSRQDEGGHFAGQLELSVGCLREHRNNEILERDHTRTQLFQFDVGRLW